MAVIAFFLIISSTCILAQTYISCSVQNFEGNQSEIQKFITVFTRTVSLSGNHCKMVKVQKHELPDVKKNIR